MLEEIETIEIINNHIIVVYIAQTVYTKEVKNKAYVCHMNHDEKPLTLSFSETDGNMIAYSNGDDFTPYVPCSYDDFLLAIDNIDDFLSENKI